MAPAHGIYTKETGRCLSFDMYCSQVASSFSLVGETFAPGLCGVFVRVCALERVGKVSAREYTRYAQQGGIPQ